MKLPLLIPLGAIALRRSGLARRQSHSSGAARTQGSRCRSCRRAVTPTRSSRRCRCVPRSVALRQVALRRQHAGQPPRGVRGRSGDLKSVSTVVVGLEPLAVAARPNGDVWVANHLSDSVSVVHVDDDGHAQLIDTLLVVMSRATSSLRARTPAARHHDCPPRQNSPDDPDLFARRAVAPTSGCSMRTIWR